MHELAKAPTHADPVALVSSYLIQIQSSLGQLQSVTVFLQDFLRPAVLFLVEHMQDPLNHSSSATALKAN